MISAQPPAIVVAQQGVPGVPAFPSPTASSAPVSERSLLVAGIDAAVARAKVKTGGKLGVVVLDLGTGVNVARNEDVAFPLASLQALPLSVVAYAAADAGKFEPDTLVEVDAADLVATGSKIAHDFSGGRRAYSFREVIVRMLDGDKTAANVVYRLLGGADAINADLHTIGIDGIVFRTNATGLLDDAASGRTFARGGDNACTPSALATLLGGLESGQILSKPSRTALLAALGRVQGGTGRLRAGLPQGTDFAHEPGTSLTAAGVTDATNDAGIARINRRSVVVVAMLQGARGSEADRDAILASIAQLTYEATRLFPMP